MVGPGFVRSCIISTWLLVTMMFVIACGSNGTSSSDNGTTLGSIFGTVSAPTGVSFQKAGPTTDRKAGTGGIAGAVCDLEGTDKRDTTDGAGQFRITDVPAGNYLLICRHTATDGNTYAFSMAVTARHGATTDIGVGRITPTGRLNGLATLEGQTDHTGIVAYIPGTSMQSRTNALGAFLIGNVPVGTYELRLERPGYVPAKLTGISVRSGEATVVENLFLNVSTGATGTITIEGGSPYSNSRAVTASITASENATLMQISADPIFVGAPWSPMASTRTWTFNSDGEKRLYVKFADADGLESAPVSATITIDTTPPSGSFLINNGASVTTTGQISLSFDITDVTTSVTEMILSNEPDFVGAEWMTFPGSGSITWSLSPGDGARTVYARFRDLMGNETEPLSSSITRESDSTAPLIFRVNPTLVGSVSASLASGDVTGDAVPDLILGTASDSLLAPQIKVLPGWRTETSLTRSLSPIEVAVSLAIGDLDGDGQNEIVSSTLTDLRVFSPSLAQLTTASLGSDLGYTVSIAALNGNRRDDVVVGLSSVFPTIRIFLDYDATLETGFHQIFDVPLPGMASTLFAAVATLNGDGNDDVVVAGGDILSVLLGDGSGGFHTPQSFPLPASATRPVPADMDHDGDIDIVVPVPAPMGEGSVGGIVILRNDGSGSLTRMAFIEDPDYPQSIAVADFNFDGYPDLAVADSCGNCAPEVTGMVKIYGSDGTGGFRRLTVSTPCPSGDACESLTRPHAIVSDDMNGDGLPDLAVIDNRSQYVTFFIGHIPPLLP